MLTIQLIGNLGADAQIRESSGRRFLSMNIAHAEKYIQNGNQVTKTQWVSVAVNHYSEKLLPYLVKGTKVYVCGKLNTSIWFDSNKMPNVSLNVMADMLELCGSRVEPSTANTSTPNYTPAAAPAPASSQAPAKTSNLPF